MGASIVELHVSVITADRATRSRSEVVGDVRIGKHDRRHVRGVCGHGVGSHDDVASNSCIVSTSCGAINKEWLVGRDRVGLSNSVFSVNLIPPIACGSVNCGHGDRDRSHFIRHDQRGRAVLIVDDPASSGRRADALEVDVFVSTRVEAARSERNLLRVVDGVGIRVEYLW